MLNTGLDVFLLRGGHITRVFTWSTYSNQGSTPVCQHIKIRTEIGVFLAFSWWPREKLRYNYPCLKPTYVITNMSSTCKFYALCAKQEISGHYRKCVQCFFGTLRRKHHLHKKLTYRFFPIMGVTVSSQRQKKVVKRVPPPSFASFSTTGTLTTSAHVDEGETESKIVLSKLKIRLIRLYKIGFIHFCF